MASLLEDYPSVAVSGDKIVIVGNPLDISLVPNDVLRNESDVFVVDKATALNGLGAYIQYFTTESQWQSQSFIGYRVAQQHWPWADDGSVVLVGTQLAQRYSNRLWVKRVTGAYPTAAIDTWSVDPGGTFNAPPLVFQPAGGYPLLDMLDQRVHQAHRAGSRVIAATNERCQNPGDPIGEFHSCTRFVGVDITTRQRLFNKRFGLGRGDCGYGASTTFGGTDIVTGTLMCVSGYAGLCPTAISFIMEPPAYDVSIRVPTANHGCYRAPNAITPDGYARWGDYGQTILDPSNSPVFLSTQHLGGDGHWTTTGILSAREYYQ